MSRSFLSYALFNYANPFPFKISSNEANSAKQANDPKNQNAKSHFLHQRFSEPLQNGCSASNWFILLLIIFICILSQNFQEMSRTFLSFAQNIYKRSDQIQSASFFIVIVYSMPIRRGSYHFFFQKRHLIKVR